MLGSHELENDVGYILASAYAQLREFEAGFELLNKVLALGQDPIMDDIYILHAHLCVKLHSDKKYLYDQAVRDFDYLIERSPEVMEYVLQRGCCYSLMQDFDKAIADFTYILYYQPSLSNVLCLRARCHACKRQWEQSKFDYDTLLYYEPENAEALQGISDIVQEYVALPMIDKEFIDGFVKD